MKKYKFYLAIFIGTILLALAFWRYFVYVQNEKEQLQNINYESQAVLMRKNVSSMILAKQKSTVAMALSLASDKNLAKNIKLGRIDEEYYTSIINSFKENTLFQNIWIQILDKNLISVYRSWTDKKGDSLKLIRSDLLDVIRTKKVTYTISPDKFDLSIKAIIPILQEGEIVGILELISHFNSISKQIKKFNIDSIVILDKKFKKNLIYPFTKLFIGDYYVANFDAPLYLREHLKDYEIEKDFDKSYIIYDKYILVTYKLRSLSGTVIGYYMMFKKLEDISQIDLDFFMFKWLAFGFLGIMGVGGVVNITMFYFMRKQKIYYKKIIDTATNIIIINNKKETLDVNKIFFKYFNKYSSFDEFKQEHSCICDFFVEKEGYLEKELNGISWIDYLLKYNEKSHKVKIKYFGDIYYFSVSASLISEEEEYYSAVFTDITKEEKYKHELEYISITDPLTSIGNRRYFQQKIKEEILRADRYDHPLSFIMLDIDYFKKVNDEHGHGVGDRVLVEYSKLIVSMLRKGDTFCRIGGEEFMIILPYANKKYSQKIAQKLRITVQEYKKVLPITMSFGVVEYIKGEDIEHILKRVDEALYEAKNSGRNRVVVK